MDSAILKIDGSFGEGGGQVLRTTTALSAIFGVPIEIHSIRAKRSKPGLAAQHLAGINLLRDVCGGTASGNCMGSQILRFHPPVSSQLKEESPNGIQQSIQTFGANVGTAGSCTLLIQVTLPYLMYSGMSQFILKLTGGTNVGMSPPAEHTQYVLLPLLQQIFPGMTYSLETKPRGYFPKGQGSISLSVNLGDVALYNPLNLTRRKSTSITAIAKPADIKTAATVETISANEVISKKQDQKDVDCADLATSTTAHQCWDIHGLIYGNVSESDKSSIAEKLCSDLSSTFDAVIEDTSIARSFSVKVDEIPDGAGAPSAGSAGRSQHGYGKKNKQPRRQKEQMGVVVWAKCTDILSGEVTAMFCSDTLCDNATDLTRDDSTKLKALIDNIEFLLRSECGVDEHTADQLVIYNALACCRLKQLDSSFIGRSYEIIVAPPSSISSQHLNTVVELMQHNTEVRKDCSVYLREAGDGTGNRVVEFHIV
jgi:RNA 3'-phosphate cyclase